MCPRPVRRPDTHFLRMGREGAHGSESRAEGQGLRTCCLRFLVAGNSATQPPKRICVRDGVPRSLPLSLSEHLVVVGLVSNTELECPSEFRASQAVARICVPVSTLPTTYPGPFEPSEA
jgi:hypothetical protein